MASNNHQQNETPTIASNSSSNAEFYDAESNDESETSCCVFKTVAEIEVTKISKEGNLKEEYCCARCGRSVEELIAREKLKQEGKCRN